MLDEVSFPRFSKEERDRRYGAVRAQMVAQGLDCLVLPHSNGDWDNYQIDIRYLTGIGGNCTGVAAVFPIEGDPIAIVRDPQRREWWKRAQNWVEDTRGKTGMWSESIVQAVKDAGHESGRIGVVGLQGHLRDPEGSVSHTEWENVRSGLREAHFEDVTEMMQEVRMEKSPEEIVFMERAADLADKASEALFESARPGVTEHEVYGQMISAMVRGGGELPTMALFVAEPEPNQTWLMPTFRSLGANDIIFTEFDAKYMGYMAQGDETFCVGTPPQEYQTLFDISLDCFNAVLEAMKPGVPWNDLIQITQDTIKKYSSEYTGGFLGHGMGLAEDGPMVRPGTMDGQLVRQGQCFILKPAVVTADGKRRNRAGNTIVVESNGARRLGKLEMKMRTLGG